MADRYFGISTLVAKIYRTVGGLFSKDQRSDRNEAKRLQKERAALLQRFKNQDADRARAAAALVAIARPKAEARALTKRREQGPSPEIK
jgi:hypothetical protein